MTEQDKNYAAEIDRLKKINAALITRIEAGAGGGAAYDSFAHSVFLADQVRERTAALNDAMQQLTQSNRQLQQTRAEAEQAQAQAEEARVQAEEARAQAVEAKTSQTRLLTAISHDIMQPVCAAQLMVANLLTSDQSSQGQSANGQSNHGYRQVNAIAQAVGDIEYLLQSLLDYARQGKQITAELRPQSVDDILASLAIESLPQAQAKGLDFIYRSSRAWVMTDGNVLTRVLRNLISNALRYTDTGEITLAVRHDADDLLVSIKDTGCGFAEAYPGELLEPFKKAANYGNNEGLGLGLANVASLCEMLGHSMDYQSQPNKGSEFCVRLPLATPVREAKPQSYPVGALPFPYAVLVIDNAAAVREALANLLVSWGACCYHYDELDSVPADVLAQIDVLVMDYHLDYQRTGLQALQTYPIDCPALFITASNDDTDLQAIKAAGYALVKKPIKPPRLRRALENLLAY